MELATPRLVLRPLDARDEALYVALYTDATVMRHVGAPLSTEAARRSFAAACRLQRPRVQRWIAIGSASSEPLGLVALVDRACDCAEPGVMLLPHAAGRGLATEAMAAACAHGFETRGLARMEALQADDGNAAVVRMMTRLGFVRGAVQPPPPAILWTLDSAGWAAARAADGKLPAFAAGDG